jgi:hypothetical protein
MSDNLTSYYNRKALRQPIKRVGSVIFEENAGNLLTAVAPEPEQATYLLLAENNYALLSENGNNLEIQH